MINVYKTPKYYTQMKEKVNKFNLEIECVMVALRLETKNLYSIKFLLNLRMRQK